MAIDDLVQRAVDGIMVSQITGEAQVDDLEVAIQDLL
jgi:thiamine biosynthesis protein ThiI